ncbi:ATP-binding protein (plasmid) [Halorarum halophilum]|uniref:ATP-binding protein n=1 Tax=Halorarum halophilum TaxID=2743090 RepID=A0A7D5GEU5_9EURY|nr:ATP-binding protein [Halobaculum halophilum]QLG30086.1 ATP-binding protein [Halobaculum halophilum]
MASDNAETTEYSTGQIGVDEERIIDELIFSQAEGLPDGIREVAQNGLDAPGSTRVEIDVTPERTVVTDDGDGMDLTDEKVREFLTHLGKSTKRGDDETIGQFGIGFGQALAKGKVTAQSGSSKVEFDAKNWYRDYRLYETDDSVSGFRVEIEHYEDEVPAADSSEWDDYVEDLVDRFQFMELVKDTEVHVNGERISDKRPEDEQDGNYEIVDTDVAYMVLKHSGFDWVRIYSAGLFVTENSGLGLAGTVVTKKNLTLNTARNSITSGCEVWADVEEELAEARASILSDVGDDKISKAGRRAIVRMFREGHDEFRDREVLKKANGEMTTIDDVLSAERVMFADQSDKAGGKLADHGEQVLMVTDKATQELIAGAEREQLTLPPEKNVQATAASQGISNGYDLLPLEEFHSKPLVMARILREKMAGYSPYSLNREIVPGDDSSANAWTLPDPDKVSPAAQKYLDSIDSDYDTYVAITDTAYSALASEVLVLELWRILAHEFAHTDDSTGEPNHGTGFHRRFRAILDATQPAAVDLMNEIRKDGVTDVFSRYDHGVPHARA